MMRFRGQYGVMLALAIVPAAAQARDNAVPAQVVGNIAGFFDPNAYPIEAVRAHEQGRIVATIAIDPAGKASRCDITTSSNSFSLDATTCSIAMTKIQFVAARDGSGQNVPGTYELKVRWVLPQPPLGINRALVTFSGAVGDATCSVVVANATRHLASKLCQDLAAAVMQREGNLSKPVLLDIPEHSDFLLPDGQ